MRLNKAYFKENLLIWIGAAALVLVILILIFSSQKKISKTIVDVSWPNCKTIPATNFQQGIIGVTGGLDFKPNPCLSEETTWFGHYALYMNTGYPGVAYGKKYISSPRRCIIADRQCLAYNYGFAAAKYGLHVAARSGAYSDLWWLDVETDNSWTNSTSVNRAVLQGAIAAIQQNSFLGEVGIYSTPNQWQAITGGWNSGLPAWLGTGLASENGAARQCQMKAFTGGTIWLSQYTIKLDQNVACSSAFTERLSSPPNTIFGSLASFATKLP
jgi:hypothetical protein